MEHLKASNQKLHNDHSLERIHQKKKNAFAALGFLFTVTSVLHCLPASSILSPMTITKAIHNLTYQIVLFYNNLVAICKIQDKTVQFLMLNIWGALEAVQARYALKSVMRGNYNRQTFWRVYTLVHLRVHGILWCYSGDLQINSAFRLPLPSVSSALNLTLALYIF